MSAPVAPQLHDGASGDLGPDVRAALCWRFPAPRTVLSSATVHGGVVRANWILNLGVVEHYRRTDLDAHVAEVAAGTSCTGAGVGLLTAADVRRAVRAVDDDVVVDATVGITKPTWAADADGAFSRRTPTEGGWAPDRSTGAPPDGAGEPGTINLVIQVPVLLEPGALINAALTATEAKAQALFDAGIPGTGTASDAVAIVCADDLGGTPERFAGPRSIWGARIARAVHRAVTTGWEAHP